MMPSSVGKYNGITNVISHIYAKIKVHSYDSLPLEKTLTFHVIILISQFLNIKIKKIKINTTITYS